MTQKGEGKEGLKGEALDTEIRRLIKEEGLNNFQISDRLGISVIMVSRRKKSMGLVKEGSEIQKWLEEHPEVKRAFGTLKPNARMNYVTYFKKFCEWVGKEPKELWEEPWGICRDRIVDYRMYLEDEGKAPNSVQVYTSAIRRFYEYQNIVFKGKFLTNGTAAQSREINEKQLITPNKLKEILDISDPMEKAMYMIQLQTGLSSHELCNLRVKDIGDVKDGKVKLRIENGLIMLKLTREKTKVRFGTFFGYDGIEALKQWIDFRQRGKAREDKAISKGAIIKTNNDFIFVGYSKRYRKWDVITPTTYAGYLRNRVRQLGWISDEDMRKNGQLNVYRPHSLRMSFSEFMKHKAHVSWDIVEHFLGHKFSSTDKAYVQFGDEDLMNAYKQGESFLNITPIEPIVTDDRYRELKLKNDRLADKISILETREAEVTLREEETKKIWARIEKMEKKFAHLVETPAKIEETTERRKEEIVRGNKRK